MKHRKIISDTEHMLDVQICCLVRPSVTFTSGRRGATMNQTNDETKKQNHEQWKAHIYDQTKERSLISVALSSW